MFRLRGSDPRSSLPFIGPRVSKVYMFISFEGIDGSGKSTHVRLLGQYLDEKGRPPLLVREPGGTDLSERVRTLLLDPEAHIVPRAELLLFSAARAQLVDEVIHPALAAGRVVIADRFYDSTTAYQGGGRALATGDWLRDFHAFVTDGLVPDRTYYIDVPLETAAARRGTDPDRMEGAGAAFFERVRAAYQHLASVEPERFVVLDGRQSVESLHAEIVCDVEASLYAEANGTGPSPSGSPTEAP